MKKIFIILGLVLFVNYTFSQKVTGGIEISPIISWMKPDITKRIDNEGVKFGFNFGFIGDLNLGDNFAFSTGILVNNFGGQLKYHDSIPQFTVDKGTSDSIYSFDPGVVIDYKLQYVEIPFSLKGKTNEIGYITYFLKAGISPMIKWKARGDVTQGNISGESITKEVTGFGFGFHVGGGIEYSLGGNTKMLIELVYTNGLSDFTKTETTEGNEKVILNCLALRLGILF